MRRRREGGEKEGEGREKGEGKKREGGKRGREGEEKGEGRY